MELFQPALISESGRKLLLKFVYASNVIQCPDSGGGATVRRVT